MHENKLNYFHLVKLNYIPIFFFKQSTKERREKSMAINCL